MSELREIALRFGREYHADDPGAMAQDIVEHYLAKAKCDPDHCPPENDADRCPDCPASSDEVRRLLIGDEVTCRNYERIPVGSIAAYPGIHHTPIWLRNDRQWVGFGGKVLDDFGVWDHGVVLLRIADGRP